MMARRTDLSYRENFGPPNAGKGARMSCVSGQLVKGAHRG